MTRESSAAGEGRRATEPLDQTDLALLAGVRDLYAAVDPVPDGLATEIKFALSVQALHAEVAELQRGDVAEHEGSLVRADEYAQTETMTFTCDQLSAMITVTRVAAETVRLDGWVTADGCRVELRVRSVDGGGDPTTTGARADADGRFTFTEVRKGLAQLVFRSEPTDGTAASRPVITPYVEI